jgi:hypothetical protein
MGWAGDMKTTFSALQFDDNNELTIIAVVTDDLDL